MARTFGVELEIVHGEQPVGFIGRVTRALRDAGLARQTIDQQHYGANDYGTWQINRDSSVHRNGFAGGEVVSRILPATEAGFTELAQACDLIAGAGATVNRTCGMHVHVDVRDLSVDEIRNVVIAYMRFQGEIDTVVPRSRRGSNQYCRHLSSSYVSLDDMITSLERAQSVSSLDYRMGGKYRVLNLSKFAYTGTIEFRQHSGTVEAAKAVAWARWCVAFVETFRHAAAPVAAAPCGGEVLERCQGRGEFRSPRTNTAAGAIVSRAAAGPIGDDEFQAIVARFPACDSPCWIAGFVKSVATRYGVSFVRTAAGWQLDNGQAATVAASPFEACFTPGGQISYFGSRRRALSR
jgi:hypothetical protein